MPNVNIKKADKLYALNQMVEAKFRERYERLLERRRELAVKMYNDTVDPIGYQLRNLAGKEAPKWLCFLTQVALPDIPVPVALVQTGKRPNMWGDDEIDWFTGEARARRYDPRPFKVQLRNGLPWLRSRGDTLEVSEASKSTKASAATLTRDTRRFNRDTKEFYDNAYSVLMQLRSSKRIDEMFPELWKYMPSGTREQIKQGLVPLTQEEVNELRKQLPK